MSPGFTQQLRLLGYQRMVNSLGFRGNLAFFSLANIIVNAFCGPKNRNHTLLLSANSGGDFRRLSPKPRESMRIISSRFRELSVSGIRPVAPVRAAQRNCRVDRFTGKLIDPCGCLWTVYLISPQLTGFRSISSTLMRLISHFLSGCFLRYRSIFIMRKFL